GKQAVRWVLKHPCELRQVALVLDWAGDQVSDSERKQLQSTNCKSTPGTIADRDALFMQIASGEDADALIEKTAKPLISQLQSGNWHDGTQLYAAFEYLYVVRFTQHTDLRQDYPRFFSSLPAALLLALKPEEVDHPDWRMHAAALVLVGIDPNLESSQYLQGWAIEDRQMISEGEGVAYELLWGDPYLPGVGYENLDPWSYDPSNGTLFARTDWNRNACWIHVSKSIVDQENCLNDWQQKPVTFGRLALIPIIGTCVPFPKRGMNEAAIVWKFQPGQTVYYLLNNAAASARADEAGMWKAPANAQDKVCTSLDTLRVPQAHKSVRK